MNHLVFLAICAVVAATRPAPIAQPDAAAASPIDDRLTRLDPARPAAYLEIAEELMAESPEEEDARRIIELLVRAAVYALDTDPEVAASACLALGEPTLGLDRNDRAWVRAVARTLVPELGQPSWLRPPGDASITDSGAGPLAATALARMRNGDPRRAALLLDEPGVLQALEASPELALVRGSQSVEAFFESYADDWPCPACRGDRFETARQGPTTTHALCAHCSGDPGPRFRTDELIVLLRAELALLGGGGGAWSSRAGGATAPPLRAPAPAELPARLGVLTDRAWWREGGWVSSPSDD